jgi:hypothetical protein
MKLGEWIQRETGQTRPHGIQQRRCWEWEIELLEFAQWPHAWHSCRPGETLGRCMPPPESRARYCPLIKVSGHYFGPTLISTYITVQRR